VPQAKRGGDIPTAMLIEEWTSFVDRGRGVDAARHWFNFKRAGRRAGKAQARLSLTREWSRVLMSAALIKKGFLRH
jgi:hypothetical protein